jgi:ribonuclease HII
MIVDLSKEFELWKTHGRNVVALAVAGYGACYGSLFVAGVVVPVGFSIPAQLTLITPHQLTTPQLRTELAPVIRRCLKNFLIEINVDQINKGSIFHLRYSETDKFLDSWDPATTLFEGGYPLKNPKHYNYFLTKNQNRSFGLAAARLLAEDAKSKEMSIRSKFFPQYHLDKNGGFLTADHKAAILKYGPTPLHRLAFIKNLMPIQEIRNSRD